MRPLCFTRQWHCPLVYTHSTRRWSNTTLLQDEKKPATGIVYGGRKFPFVLYDPYNEAQQTFLRKALTEQKVDDSRFKAFRAEARVQFYDMIAGQVRTMYRYEHLQYATLLRKMNAENPLRGMGELGNNPFLYKVGDVPHLVYRHNPKLERNGVWDTIDINVLVGLIWEVVSRQEIVYYNDILKQLPMDVRNAIKVSFHDIRQLIGRYPFTFEIVRKGFIRFVPTLTF
ncbi:protein tyrosine kinase [Perkinsela sp. CCAP 1560/4]|nr:protein tyrosine kinase [Perkinsela sp. CCAP 1560/4]|eukprot:KNH04832.1 protein tyrosine kinase [Perkinsela sp. CCAP 1560/4]